jgi:septal ring factor EnvC (AmiA/AmiB activator)
MERYGELHSKAYANILALTRGNKALQDQLELTISVYADEISKLKASLRKAEAEHKWVDSQMRAMKHAKEGLEGHQSDEVLEFRDKLHEYNRRLQAQAGGGSLPDLLSQFNLATLCNNCREPRALGSSGDSSPV